MTVMVLKVFFVALLNVLNMSEFTVIFDSEQDSIRSYIHAFKEVSHS